jgi:hypothetical protein
MERMGHSSPRAALIYLHATRERDQQIAAGMGKLYSDARKAVPKNGHGPEAIGHGTGTRHPASLKETVTREANYRADLHRKHKSGRR